MLDGIKFLFNAGREGVDAFPAYHRRPRIAAGRGEQSRKLLVGAAQSLLAAVESDQEGVEALLELSQVGLAVLVLVGLKLPLELGELALEALAAVARLRLVVLELGAERGQFALLLLLIVSIGVLARSGRAKKELAHKPVERAAQAVDLGDQVGVLLQGARVAQPHGQVVVEHGQHRLGQMLHNLPVGHAPVEEDAAKGTRGARQLLHALDAQRVPARHQRVGAARQRVERVRA